MSSHSTVGSRSSRIVSPEAYETRPSSTSIPTTPEKNPCGEDEDDREETGRRVGKGKQAVVALPSSIELFVEYTTGPSSKSKYLRFKARQLSEEEAAVALGDDAAPPVYDLASLGYDEVKVEESRGGYQDETR